MIVDGIVYGYTVHKQTDPFCCDCPRCSPSGPAVWRATGPVTASGSAETPAAEGGAEAGGGSGASVGGSSSETPQQKLDRLVEERRDGLYAVGALLGGVLVGLMLKGKE